MIFCFCTVLSTNFEEIQIVERETFIYFLSLVSLLKRKFVSLQRKSTLTLKAEHFSPSLSGKWT